MPTWSSAISLKGVAGAAGISVLSGTGAPASTLGVQGQTYIDTSVPNLYVKGASAWGSAIPMVGPSGSNATLPTDITGNSIILAPVSGDATATQVTIKNSSGSVLFTATATGISTSGTLYAGGAASVASLTTTGATSVGGGLTVTGGTTSGGYNSTTAGTSSLPLLQYTAKSSGTNYLWGQYTDSNFAQHYELVAGTLARSVTFVGTNPNSSSANFFTHSFYSGVNGTNVAHRWYANGSTLAFQIFGNSSASFAAALGVAGGLTAGGVTLSSGALTFADGTTQSTASTTPSTYAATAAGTIASPAFRYSAASAGAGMYFDANGNVLLSVNGYKSLFSTAASGAAVGANGWAIASTLGSGSSLLALYGSASTTTPVWSVDGAGAVSSSSQTVAGALTAGSLATAGTATAANVTISASGGKLTFGDGTSMTTAATGSAGAAGSQTRYGTGAPSSTNPAVQNDGDSYIDQAQSMLYGPRANGAWPTTPVSLVGPTGPMGSVGAAGSAGLNRSILYTGTYWNSATVANGTYQMQESVINSNTNGSGLTPATVTMMRAGSITGYSFAQAGPATGTFSLIVYKNGASYATFSAISTGTKSVAGTVAVGTYTFVAGDYLNVYVNTTGTGNLQSISYLEVTTS